MTDERNFQSQASLIQITLCFWNTYIRKSASLYGNVLADIQTKMLRLSEIF
jgi:hypothetical protein